MAGALPEVAGVEDVTAVVVNFRTEQLTRQCVESLLQAYPTIRVVLVDNGSADGSTAYLHDAAQRENVSCILNEVNRYHGPGLDQGIRAAESRFVLTLDSDAEVTRPGFVEAMVAALAEPGVYAVGEVRLKSRYGYTFGYGDHPPPRKRVSIPYAHPWAMMLDRATYLTLPPFRHHGAPCLANMRAAAALEYRVVEFPASSYLVHHFRGTSSAHGYGWRHRARQIVERRLEALEGLVTGERTIEITNE